MSKASQATDSSWKALVKGLQINFIQPGKILSFNASPFPSSLPAHGQRPDKGGDEQEGIA